MVTKLPGMDSEADLVLATKKDQAELLTAVLKASDDDADEEVIQTSSVSTAQVLPSWSSFLLITFLLFLSAARSRGWGRRGRGLCEPQDGFYGIPLGGQ